MRLSLRFIVPLGIALAAIAYAVVPLVDRLTLKWFVQDLERRAELVANTMQEPFADLLHEHSRVKLVRYFDRVIRNERIFAIGFCQPDGGMLYATRAFPPQVKCDPKTLAADRDYRVYVLIFPLLFVIS